MQPTMLEIEQAVAAIDPAPWRAVFDEGDLVIYFHADLFRDPVRIVISDSTPPSPNEYAAAAFLVNSREYVRALCERVHELEHALAVDSARSLLARFGRDEEGVTIF